jgi:hypothetical protein
MESFDPFLNSISTSLSSVHTSKLAANSRQFMNSIPRQPAQKTPSKPPPAFDPAWNSLLPSKPVLALGPVPNSTSSTNLPTLKPLQISNPTSLKPLPKLLPTSQPSPRTTRPRKRRNPSLGNQPPNTPSLRPFPTSTTPSSLTNSPILRPRKVKKQRTTKDTNAREAVEFATGLLEDEFSL